MTSKILPEACLSCSRIMSARGASSSPKTMRALELFAGVGGGSLALRAANVRTSAYCEINPWSQAVLRDNIARGRLDAAPIFPDVRELEAKQVRGPIDVIAGGFPCQGLSLAGRRRGLFGDERSRLVKELFRLVREARPSYVFCENTPAILKDPSYSDVLARFRRMGYRCAHMLVSASQVGAPHKRARWFLLCALPEAPPLRFCERRTRRLERHFRQRVTKKLVPRDANRARRICTAFGNCVVPAQALLALRALHRALHGPPPSAPPTSKGWKPTLALSGARFAEDESYEVPSADCRGPGFNVTPPRASGSKGTSLRPLTRPFWSACMPTARANGSVCSVGIGTMTRRSADDAGNFLLRAHEMHGGRVAAPQAHVERMVSDRFWAAAFGFPQDWISGPLASERAREL